MEYILMSAAGVCAVTDYKFRKIPNLITFPLLILALSWNIYLGNWQLALIGFGVAFGIGFLGFATGHLGAGDVKLMAGIGAALGVNAFIEILLISTIVGLLYGLVSYIKRSLDDGSLKSKWINFKITFLNLKVFGKDVVVNFFKREERYPIPFGLCLAVGLIISLAI